jgi:hypothetical protein
VASPDFGIDRQNEFTSAKWGPPADLSSRKSARSAAKDLPPSRLSQTGLFIDLTTLEPALGLIPYEVNSPLWSDGAVKMRWIGGAIERNDSV